MKKTFFSVHPCFPLVLAVGLFTETLGKMLMVYLCLFIHELGHIAAAKSFGINPSYIKLMPFGIGVRFKTSKISNKKNIVIALSGPLISILSALLFKNEFLKMSNLCLGIFNLLPVKTLDGGSIFFAVYSKLFGSIKAYNTLKRLSSAFSVLFLCTGAYVLYATRFNVSLVLVASFLMYHIVCDGGYGRVSAAISALDYKRKTTSDGVFDIKSIAIAEDTPFRRILKHIPEGRLCRILILDHNMKLITAVSEQTAVDIMTKYGAGITYRQLGENINEA